MSTAVFFFGGYNASQDDVDAWARSARQQKPTVSFTVFPWASGPKSAPKDVVVKGAVRSGQFKAAVELIDACPADTVYIVGHSSGCAVANAVDKAVANGNRVALIALDGFAPDADQLKRSSTQVWGAECEGVKSKNYPGASGGRRRVYSATNCRKLWALHFSVVNAAATDKTVSSVATGYINCTANLAWL